MSRLVLMLAALILTSGATFAQSTTFGSGTPGSGSHVPLHTANGPWLGSTNFQLQVDRGIGGGTCFMLLSVYEASLPFAGGTVYVSLTPPNPVLFFPLPLGGTLGAPGEGSVALPIPLPAIPTLVGMPVYSQAIIDEGSAGSSMIVLSNGVRHELSLPPELFLGCSIAGSTDPYQFIDPVSPTIIDSGGNPGTDNVTAAVYAHGGKDIFTASSIQNAIAHADTSTHPATFSQIYFSSGFGCYGLGIDRANDLLWTLTDPGTGARELTAIEPDPLSSVFGKQLFHTTNMTGGTSYVEKWSLAPSGTFAAVLTFWPSNIIIVDTDPLSPTFLQTLQFVSMPVADGFSLGLEARITPDEQFVIVPILNFGTPTEIARYHVPSATFWDHNPAVPGIQHIGINSNPVAYLPDTTTYFELASDGSFAAMGGSSNCGWTGRMDFDLTDPSYYSFTLWQMGTGMPNSWGGDLSEDDQIIAISSWPASGCTSTTGTPMIYLLDASNGTVLGSVTIPFNSNPSSLQNLYNVRFR